MQSCLSLDDKQLTREISDFLTFEKSLQSTSPSISISLFEFEKKLSQKFKCSVELDKQRITEMVKTIISARNKYLEFSQKNLPIKLFVLVTEIPPSIFPKISEKAYPDLASCFSGRVQIQGEDIKTAHWPVGLYIVPNFLTDLQHLSFQTDINNPQSFSVKLECLSKLLSQYKFVSSIPCKTSIHQNPTQSSGIKFDISGTIILLMVGNTVSGTMNHKGTNINIPLTSGSLLHIDSSLHDWNIQISSPKIGMNYIIQFKC